MAEHVGAAVVVECVIRGTREDAWRGLPPTGRRLEIPLCGVCAFDDRVKLAGERIYCDRATVLRQLALFREPTSLAARLPLMVNRPVNPAKAWVASLGARRGKSGRRDGS